MNNSVFGYLLRQYEYTIYNKMVNNNLSLRYKITEGFEETSNAVHPCVAVQQFSGTVGPEGSRKRRIPTA